MITYDQRMDVRARVEELVQLGRDKLGADLESPLVKFDKRGTTAGTANSEYNYVNFNVGLMADNWQHFMEDTIPHEVAHLIKDNLYGRGKGVNSPHGFYWQQVMLALGVEPKAKHSMDVRKVAMPKTKHLYMCPVCKAELVLTQVRHNRIQRGTKRYIHNCSQSHSTGLQHVRSLGKVTWREAAEHRKTGAPAKQAQRKPTEPKKGTKIAHAMLIYRAMINGNIGKRKDIILSMVYSMRVSEAQAVNYYQQCKRRLG